MQGQPKRSVFKRGQKAELFEDGSGADERAELQGKLDELHSVWSTQRTGRDLAAAIWRPELRLAEVVLQKGKLLAHMGVARGAKLYLVIEEAVYLLDRANLLLFLDRPHSAAGGQARAQLAKPRQCLLSLAEATDLMLTTGVSMDRYLVFCKLLRAGYIVQRHPARWLLRPGQDLAHAGAGLDRAPAAAASSADQQQQQQQVVSGTESSAPGSSTLPRAPGPKRRKVPAQPQRSRTWWYGSPQASALGQHTGEPAASPGSANPWLRCLPAEFVSSLPRCTVLPDAAQHARASFPHMAPLQALPLAELQPLTGPAGGQHLLHYDVFNSNSRFSRKTAGRPVFVVSVLPCTQLPTPHDLAAADMAADGVPVRFSTVENGDICFYGLSHVELAQLARS